MNSIVCYYFKLANNHTNYFFLFEFAIYKFSLYGSYKPSIINMLVILVT